MPPVGFAFAFHLLPDPLPHLLHARLRQGQWLEVSHAVLHAVQHPDDDVSVNRLGEHRLSAERVDDIRLDGVGGDQPHDFTPPDP